jgi:hypothetical protein
MYKLSKNSLFQTGIVIYGPATALSSLTDLSTEVSIGLIGVIATFYTVRYEIDLFSSQNYNKYMYGLDDWWSESSGVDGCFSNNNHVFRNDCRNN